MAQHLLTVCFADCCFAHRDGLFSIDRHPSRRQDHAMGINGPLDSTVTRWAGYIDRCVLLSPRYELGDYRALNLNRAHQYRGYMSKVHILPRSLMLGNS